MTCAYAMDAHAQRLIEPTSGSCSCAGVAHSAVTRSGCFTAAHARMCHLKPTQAIGAHRQGRTPITAAHVPT
eukprot:scaffold32821_cov112-Isochrysis_galbana.AAC.1